MARSNIRRPPVEPCTAATYHRWKPRLTHHSTSERQVWDDKCIRCGQWLTDVMKR